jgi:hypothetical protein
MAVTGSAPRPRAATSPARALSRTFGDRRRQHCKGILHGNEECGTRLSKAERKYGLALCDGCYERTRYGEDDPFAVKMTQKYKEKLGPLLRTVFLYGQSDHLKIVALVLMAIRPCYLCCTRWGGAWNDPGRAEIYLVEGVTYCTAYACGLFFVDRFKFKCNVVARWVQFQFWLVPTWEGGAVPLHDVWFAARLLAMGGMTAHTLIHASAQSDYICRALHLLFYAPLWSMLALWIGSCAELASRTQTITHHVKVLMPHYKSHRSSGAVQEADPLELERVDSASTAASSTADKRPWKNLRSELRDLHVDAKKLSAWWTVYALGGMIANVHYVSRTFQSDCIKHDLSTLGGMVGCIRDHLGGYPSLPEPQQCEGSNLATITRMTMPLLLSLFVISVCEALPNTASACFLSKVKNGFIYYGAEEDSWDGLLECAERSVPTFRFWLVGKFRFINVLKCQILYQVVKTHSASSVGGEAAAAGVASILE